MLLTVAPPFESVWIPYFGSRSDWRLDLLFLASLSSMFSLVKLEIGNNTVY